MFSLHSVNVRGQNERWAKGKNRKANSKVCTSEAGEWQFFQENMAQVTHILSHDTGHIPTGVYGNRNSPYEARWVPGGNMSLKEHNLPKPKQWQMKWLRQVARNKSPCSEEYRIVIIFGEELGHQKLSDNWKWKLRRDEYMWRVSL